MALNMVRFQHTNEKDFSVTSGKSRVKQEWKLLLHQPRWRGSCGSSPLFLAEWEKLCSFLIPLLLLLLHTTENRCEGPGDGGGGLVMAQNSEGMRLIPGSRKRHLKRYTLQGYFGVKLGLSFKVWFLVELSQSSGVFRAGGLVQTALYFQIS